MLFAVLYLIIDQNQENDFNFNLLPILFIPLFTYNVQILNNNNESKD